MNIQCELCLPELNPDQHILFENDYCRFLQLDEARRPEIPLEGAGLIVPIAHRESAFELTKKEWLSTYELLQQVKDYIDRLYRPDGYNLGWNCGTSAGQHIGHAHFHVLPRYKNEYCAGKGIRALFKSRENCRGREAESDD
jgi:histidine triad (HIT) family protein